MIRGSTGSTLPLVVIQEIRFWRTACVVAIDMGLSRPSRAASSKTSTPRPSRIRIKVVDLPEFPLMKIMLS